MTNLIPTLKYFCLTWKHKWFVLLAGRKLGVGWWRLIKHDWSKFLLSELPHYGRQFFGPADRPYEFALCWLRHQNRHEHHWEYWLPRTGHSRCDPPFPDNEPIRMGYQATLEMMADWMGASRAYEGHWPDLNNWTWVKENLPKMRLHKYTRNYILATLQELKEHI